MMMILKGCLNGRHVEEEKKNGENESVNGQMDGNI